MSPKARKGEESTELATPAERFPKLAKDLQWDVPLYELKERLEREAVCLGAWALSNLRYLAEHGDKEDIAKVQATRLIIEMVNVCAKSPISRSLTSPKSRDATPSIRAGRVVIIDSKKAEELLRGRRMQVGHGPMGIGAPAVEDPLASTHSSPSPADHGGGGDHLSRPGEDRPYQAGNPPPSPASPSGLGTTLGEADEEESLPGRGLT